MFNRIFAKEVNGNIGVGSGAGAGVGSGAGAGAGETAFNVLFERCFAWQSTCTRKSKRLFLSQLKDLSGGGRVFLLEEFLNTNEPCSEY